MRYCLALLAEPFKCCVTVCVCLEANQCGTHRNR